MTFGPRKLSSCLVLASLVSGSALTGCSSASGGDSSVHGTSSQAVNCASGGIHVEDCFDPGPITIPPAPPPPQPVTCVYNPLCSKGDVKPDFADTGFDPGWSPLEFGHGFWGEDPAFAQSLTENNCTPERYYYAPHPNEDGGTGWTPGAPGDQLWWASTVCPRTYFPPSTDTAGIITCDQCTDTPANTDYHVIVWATVEPHHVSGGPPIITEGCDEDSCDGICNDLTCLEPAALQ